MSRPTYGSQGHPPAANVFRFKGEGPCERCKGGERACALEERVRWSVDDPPLNSYDHLCYGNAAIAEYYLTVADHEAAGRVLDALLGRRWKEGEYHDAYSAASGQVSASLFNGICGIGYEMLRYAHPHDVPSVL